MHPLFIYTPWGKMTGLDFLDIIRILYAHGKPDRTGQTY